MHEYMRRIEKAIENGIMPSKAVVANALISHDLDCGIFNGKECNCDPNIEVVINSEVIKIYKDGSYKVIRRVQ